MEHHLRCATYDLLTADRVAHSMWITTTRSSTKKRKMDGMPKKARKWWMCTRLILDEMDETKFLHLKPQRWCAWTSPCTFDQCCDVGSKGTWSLQERGCEINNEHHINLHPTSNVWPFGTSIRNGRIVSDGRGRKMHQDSKLPLAWLCWCAWHAHDTWHICWEIASILTNQIHGQAIRLGSCLAFLSLNSDLQHPTFHLRLMANHLETLPSTYGLEPYGRDWWCRQACSDFHIFWCFLSIVGLIYPWICM